MKFYQGNNKNTNTLLITTVGHPASDLMKRNQNMQHVMYQVKYLSFKVKQKYIHGFKTKI